MRKDLVLALFIAAIFPAWQKCGPDKVPPPSSDKPTQAQVEAKKDDASDNSKLSQYHCLESRGEKKYVTCVDFDHTATKEDAKEMCRQIQEQHHAHGSDSALTLEEGICPTKDRVGTCSLNEGSVLIRYYAPGSVEEAKDDCQPDKEHPEQVPVFIEN